MVDNNIAKKTIKRRIPGNRTGHEYRQTKDGNWWETAEPENMGLYSNTGDATGRYVVNLIG